MKISPTFFAAAALLAATNAHASLETWRLAATAYNQSGGFIPPAFAAVGQNISIDYLIDNQAPHLLGGPGTYFGAIISISFNGQVSQASGYIVAEGWGLNAMKVWPISGRADGVDFLSFNNLGGQQTTTIIEALNDFSAAVLTPSTDLRIDFGSNSVWASPTSFSAVPIPAASWLLGSGLLSLIGVARRKAA